jgi:hypothetical protein
MSSVPRKRTFGSRAAAVLVTAGVLVVSASLPASARWTIHNDVDVTSITAPPGGNDRQTCSDTLRGQTGWSEFSTDPGAVTTLPDYAFQPVPYVIYLAPPGSLPDGDFVESGTVDGGFDYSDTNGLHPASLIVNFSSGPRTLLNPPQVSEVPDVYVFTSGDFSVALPSSVTPGAIIGVKPANGGSTFITLTAIDCPVSARIDVLPGIRPNYVVPSLRAPVLPVLVYGSAALDVRSITSVRLQNAAPGSVPSALTRPFDANHDGKLDRVYWFSPAATGITCGQTSVTLTGGTSAGRSFTGRDAIRTVC